MLHLGGFLPLPFIFPACKIGEQIVTRKISTLDRDAAKMQQNSL